MAIHTSLPIYKDAYELLDVVTDLAKNMPRDFKASIGGVIRDDCVKVTVLIFRANVACKWLANPKSFGYSSRITEKNVIGIGVPNDSGESRNNRNGLAAFSIVSSPMAARSRSRKTRRFSSAVAGTPTRSSRRPSLAWGASVFEPTAWRPAMPKSSIGARSPSRTTTNALNFFGCNLAQDALFSVNAGVPAVHALEQASCFLASALGVVAATAEEMDTDSAWSAVYLLDMAKAVVDSTILSIYKEERNRG